MTTKRAGSPYDLCNFVFADGRGCCMPSIPSLNGYCRSHGTVLKPRPAGVGRVKSAPGFPLRSDLCLPRAPLARGALRASAVSRSSVCFLPRSPLATRHLPLATFSKFNYSRTYETPGEGDIPVPWYDHAGPERERNRPEGRPLQGMGRAVGFTGDVGGGVCSGQPSGWFLGFPRG